MGGSSASLSKCNHGLCSTCANIKLAANQFRNWMTYEILALLANYVLNTPKWNQLRLDVFSIDLQPLYRKQGKYGAHVTRLSTH